MIPIGAFVVDSRWGDKKYREILARFDYLYPWLFGKRYNDIASFAQDYDIELRGNFLVTAKFKPKEVDSIEVLESYIDTKVKAHPQIIRWDCVHEAFGDNGQLRNSRYADILGYDWISKVFQLTYQLYPNLKLYYSDYFRTTEKWQSVYEACSRWIREGVPISGLCVQLHSNICPVLNCKDIKKYIRLFKELGVEVHCSETTVWQPSQTLDIDLVKRHSNIKKEVLRHGAGHLLMRLVDVEKIQANVYKKIIESAFNGGADSVCFSSLIDNQWNWIGNRANGGLLKEDYSTKLSWEVLSEMFLQLK